MGWIEECVEWYREKRTVGEKCMMEEERGGEGRRGGEGGWRSERKMERRGKDVR